MQRKGLFILFILLLPIFLFSQGAQHSAQILFNEKQYDFKTVIQGTVAEHIFRFKNIGNDTLRIYKVKPG